MKKTLILSGIVAAIVAVIITFLFGGRIVTNSVNTIEKMVGAAPAGQTRGGDLCQGAPDDQNVACIGAAAGVINVGSSQGSWQNTTGRTVWVNAEFETSGSASSTFFVSIGTSTASSFGAYKTLLNPTMANVEISTGTARFLWTSVQQSMLATSTFSQNQTGYTATTTQFFKAKQILFQKGTAGLGGYGMVEVKPLEYVNIVILDQGIEKAGACSPTTNDNAGLCEYASSSAAGILPLNWRFWYDYVATTTPQ